MRILLVNAYSQSDEGRRRYREFREIFLQILTRQNDNLEWREYDLVERNKNDVDDYLFDLNTSYSKKESANNFDIIDLICVAGDVNLLPWQKSAEKVLILIKMCLRVKKWLFAVGFGMNALIYLSASNIEKPIRVINGNGRGGKLADLNTLDFNTMNLGYSDYFLDHVTGDLYAYKHEYEEWIPFTNVGLHYQRAANEYNSIGKYVVNAPVYRAKTQTAANEINLIESSETICRLKKHEYHHWLLADINPEFVVATKSRWEVHPFSFLDSGKIFSILAESKTGPMIIEYKNIVGVQFDIQKRYPGTIQVLKNFLQLKLRTLAGDQASQLAPVFKYKELETKDNVYFGYVFKKNGTAVEVKGATESAFAHSRGFKSIEDFSQGQSNENKRQMNLSFSSTSAKFMPNALVPQKVFSHSGYASKQKGPQIVFQNVIADGKIQAPKKAKKKSLLADRLDSLRVDSEERDVESIKLMSDSVVLDRAQSPKSGIYRHQNRTVRPSVNMTSFRMTQNNEGDLSPTRLLSEGDQASFNKATVRKLIYPNLRKEFIGEESTWVPGNLAQNTQNKQETKKPVIRLNEHMYSTGVFFKKSKKLREILLSPEPSTGSVQQKSPYLTPQEAQRKEQVESDKKILFGKFFNTSSKLSFNRLHTASSPKRHYTEVMTK